jgi:hypothetical protein
LRPDSEWADLHKALIYIGLDLRIAQHDQSRSVSPAYLDKSLPVPTELPAWQKQSGIYDLISGKVRAIEQNCSMNGFGADESDDPLGNSNTTSPPY